MAKRLQNLQTGKHVLAKLRETIGVKIEDNAGVKDALGISSSAVQSAQCGRMPFGLHTASKVAAATGVSVKWLLTGDGNKPPIMENGQPFTKDTFLRHRMDLEKFKLAFRGSRDRGNECFRFYLLLCIKLGRVMLAATDAKDAKFAAWKMRHELLQVGAKYPAFESKDVLNGVVKNQTSPESFDYGLQTMLNTGTLPKKLWATILDRFHNELCAIETRQAKAAKKPKVKPANLNQPRRA
jgi:hypothetical protein